jgi:PhnB protein
MISLNPYLVYNGNCEKAFNFYQKVFSGSDLYIARYKDTPEEAKKFFANAADEGVMHGTLKLNENTTIMGNDNADPSAKPSKSTSTDFYLYIDVEDPKEAIRIFNELAEAGTTILPIAQTFWSPLYGILIDEFGIYWKITSHQNLEA